MSLFGSLTLAPIFPDGGPVPTVGLAGRELVGRPGTDDPATGHRPFPGAVEAPLRVDALHPELAVGEGAAEGARGDAVDQVGAADHGAVEAEIEGGGEVLRLECH